MSKFHVFKSDLLFCKLNDHALKADAQPFTPMLHFLIGCVIKCFKLPVVTQFKIFQHLLNYQINNTTINLLDK